MKDSKKKVLSLFSGCGGMDLGFEGQFEVFEEAVNESIHPDWIESRPRKGWVKLKPLPYNLTFANDIKISALKVWTEFFKRRGYSQSIFHTESIVDLVKNHKDKKEKIFPSNIDVVIGGFPCQDFSIAGKRRGFQSHKSHNNNELNLELPNTENRGQLYIWMKEVIEITKPKIFIAENVKGLVNLSNVKEIIQKDFSQAGANGYYVFDPRVLYAPDYGIPQTRERVFFIGVRKDLLQDEVLQRIESGNINHDINPYPFKTHLNPDDFSMFEKDILKPYVPAHVAFRDLNEPDYEQTDESQMAYSRAKFMGHHCQGQKEIDLGKPSFTIRAEHHGNIEFRRLSEGNGGRNKSELALGQRERRLSVRECARLQTFPDDFNFVQRNKDAKGYYVNASDAYKVIGNAVPPLLAYHIADRLNTIWNNLFK